MSNVEHSSTPPPVAVRTGQLFGDLWNRFDDELFEQSVALWKTRWLANGESAEFFTGKRCLDAACGGGRYSFAMRRMGAAGVVGVDVGEEGLADARRRAAEIGITEVEFRHASVLDLPFEDQAFDFACCSGALHHTPSIERGLAELERVLRPQGSLYLLLYGAGGLYWPLNLLMRPFAQSLGYAEVDRCIGAAGFAANKRRTILDDLFVPILETYAPERVNALLQAAGFARWRRWGCGQSDQESDAATMLAELRQREQVWRVGALTASDPAAARLELHLRDLCRATVDAAEELMEQHQRGGISDLELNQAVIGTGHHRIIAEKS